MWEIELYKTKDGKEVMVEFLDSLPKKHKAKAFWEIDLLAEQGRELREPYAKHLEDEIWYLRIKFSSDISRVFYFQCDRFKTTAFQAVSFKRNLTHR